ncbi:hypothetical protein FKP32DRAFT_597700 [Trametes sanguinea]|nr:hypothetical protein FKP32DRAFT_597700 [Trametes sanguinea]
MTSQRTNITERRATIHHARSNPRLRSLPLLQHIRRAVDERALALPSIVLRAPPPPADEVLSVFSRAAALLRDDVGDLVQLLAPDQRGLRPCDSLGAPARTGQPVLGHVRGDRLRPWHEHALRDLLALALDRRVVRARVLLALAQRVLEVDHRQPRGATGHARDVARADAKARKVRVLGAVQVQERVEFEAADRRTEHLADTLEGAGAQGDPFVLGIAKVRSHVQVEEQSTRKTRQRTSNVNGRLVNSLKRRKVAHARV